MEEAEGVAGDPAPVAPEQLAPAAAAPTGVAAPVAEAPAADAQAAGNAPGAAPEHDRAEAGTTEETADPLPTAWKGSMLEVAEIFRLTLQLFERANGKRPALPGLEPISVTTQTRTLGFATVDAFEAAAPDIDLESLQWINCSFYGGEQVTGAVTFYASSGATYSLRGKDAFAVAGIAKELDAALKRGARWREVRLLRSPMLGEGSIWLAIIGLGLAILIGGITGKAIGLGLVAIALVGLCGILFGRFIQPRLVPPLELLQDPKEQTRAQRWRTRAVRTLALLGAGVLGALINKVVDLI